MSTLLDAGLDLKKIQVQEFSRVIADINHNFTKILNLPGFRGVPGEDGESITGPVGQRGNIWVFGNSDRFISAYSELSTATQITARFLSNALNDDDVKLYDVLQIEDLIDNDVVVLPSGPVVQLQTDLVIDGTLQQPTFTDTGITFANQAGVTEDKVRDIVNNLLSGISSDDSGINRLYTAYAKNVSDIQGAALNTQSSNDSAIDIDSSQASKGASAPLYKFIAGREESIDARTKLCLIAGHPNDYYTLLQNTLIRTNYDFAPGVDNFPALVVQQNDYKSGISLGFGKTDGVPSQTGPSFRDFANIYKTETSLDIESRRSTTNFTTDASRLRLTNTMIEARSSAMNVITTGNFSIGSDRFIFGQNDVMFWKNGRIFLGRGGATPFVQINTDDLNLTRQTNYDFVSTDNAGKVINKYTLKQTIDPSNTSVISGSAIHSAIQSLNSTISAINASLSNRITSLENADTTGYFNVRNAFTSGSVNVNSLVEHGTYTLQFVNSAAPLVLSNSPIAMVLNARALVLVFQNNASEVNNEKIIAQYFIHSLNGTNKVFYRMGTRNSTTYSYTSWQENVDTTRRVNASNGLTGGGTLSSDVTISHATNSIADIENVQERYISGMKFDEYGHPLNITVTNGAGIFLKRSNNLSELNNADIALSNLGGSIIGKRVFRSTTPSDDAPRFLSSANKGNVFWETAENFRKSIGVESKDVTSIYTTSSNIAKLTPCVPVTDVEKGKTSTYYAQRVGAFVMLYIVASFTIPDIQGKEIFMIPYSIPAPNRLLYIPILDNNLYGRANEGGVAYIDAGTRVIRRLHSAGSLHRVYSMIIYYPVQL